MQIAKGEEEEEEEEREKERRNGKEKGRDMGRWFCETLESRIPLRKHRFEKNIWIIPDRTVV